MPTSDLDRLEQEVQAARTKLVSDLSTLRAPSTAAEFTDALKQEANEAKDALLEKAKSSAKSSFDALVDDLKARAAANPAATLAIGAGVAWRLIRHPPIATALVGVGLYSLFRTPPANVTADDDYLDHATSRLSEQAHAAASAATLEITSVAETVSEKLTETVGSLKDRMVDASAGATQAASETISRLSESTMDRLTSADLTEGRDKLLLGVAGAAIVAALGIACQRRVSDEG